MRVGLSTSFLRPPRGGAAVGGPALMRPRALFSSFLSPSYFAGRRLLKRRAVLLERAAAHQSHFLGLRNDSEKGHGLICKRPAICAIQTVHTPIRCPGKSRDVDRFPGLGIGQDS
jgi:hypothetical protein